MPWYDLFSADAEKWLTLAVLVVAFSLVLYRRFNIAYVMLAGAGLLIVLGIAAPDDAFLGYVNWSVLAIYFGYGMLAFNFRESRLASWIAVETLKRIKKEKYAIFFLCVFAAFLSSFMANPVVVIILAPVALEIADRVKSSPFVYLIGLAISSNVVTTVTMISDPPALILALETGMKFLDFYWFQGKIGLGTLSLVGIGAALATLLVQFRGLNKEVGVVGEQVRVTTLVPVVIFLVSIVLLSLSLVDPGIIGFLVGVAALLVGRSYGSSMFREFDWNSILFLVGIFIVVAAVEQVGLLQDAADQLGNSGIISPVLYLFIFVWISVALSSFIDNVPYTVLMIPVCASVAEALGVSPFPFYFGMLAGTGMGGNITPVGATANVLACGMLEKRGYKIDLPKFMAISVPFTIMAVLPMHLLIQFLWL